jgi:predicted  nucleic acid-binding Zn-ribbon protein
MYLKSDDYVESKYLADIMDKQTLELESLRKTLEVHNNAILKLQEEIEHLYSDLSTNDDKLLAIEDKLETKASKKKVRRAENHIDMLNQYIANKLSPLIQCCSSTTRDDTIHEDA